MKKIMTAGFISLGFLFVVDALIAYIVRPTSFIVGFLFVVAIFGGMLSLFSWMLAEWDSVRRWEENLNRFISCFFVGVAVIAAATNSLAIILHW